MNRRFSADRWLALFFLGFAVILVFIWIPLDTDTGLVEKVRRKLTIGDALGPTVAGTILGLGAILLLFSSSRDKTLQLKNLRWIFSLLALFTVSLLLMRYLGPVVFAASEQGYRPFRATPPLNYIGFIVGGTVIVGGLTGLAMKRFSIKDFAVGFAAALIIALLYDLPFDDLLLPPNGDV